MLHKSNAYLRGLHVISSIPETAHLQPGWMLDKHVAASTHSPYWSAGSHHVQGVTTPVSHSGSPSMNFCPETGYPPSPPPVQCFDRGGFAPIHRVIPQTLAKYVSYLSGHGFLSRPGDKLSRLAALIIFHHSLNENPRTLFQIRPQPLPHTFQFIIH
jgi:hypothetical protein